MKFVEMQKVVRGTRSHRNIKNVSIKFCKIIINKKYLMCMTIN